MPIDPVEMNLGAGDEGAKEIETLFLAARRYRSDDISRCAERTFDASRVPAPTR